MRFKVVVSVLTVVGACSCSSTPLMVASPDGGDGGSGGGDGGDGSVACSSNKPQTTMGGSCTQPGFVAADAGDAGAPPPFCVDFTGSGQMSSDTQLSCKTMGGIFSMSTCAASNTAQTVVGYCLKACGTSQETTQYYYNTGANVAKAQCQALNYLWVSM